MKYAKIAVSDVTFWVDRPYDYCIPDTLSSIIKPGIRVTVPFSRGNRRAEGIVLSVSDNSDYDSPKSILSVLDEQPIITGEHLRLAIWMRERFFCTIYEALKAILPAGLWFKSDGSRKTKDRLNEYVRLEISGEEAMVLAENKASRAKSQAALLRFLAAVGQGSVSEICAITSVSRKSIRTLVDAGILTYYWQESFRRPEYRIGQNKASLPILTLDQKNAFDGLKHLYDSRKACGSLLYGVTGSGKTSVYIHLISYVLQQNRTVILLVPEIALTPQMLETFSSYFGDQIAVMHSSLTSAERYDEWKRVRSGQARLVIGTRSAIFAPALDIGLIIIDEEHEESYKSDNSPRYHARDVAKYRCAEHSALLVLGSATPDICTRYDADSGKLSLFTLFNRFNRLALPDVKIIDMKQELRNGNGSSISSFLQYELEKNIVSGEQSILFLNRRGTAKLITCVDCGYVYSCPNCSVNLTYHASNGKLLCHTCGYSRKPTDRCPDCGGELKYTGDGTERVEQQIKILFPGVDTLRVDTDTVFESGGHSALFSRFQEEKIPIMIGTQMVSKGLNSRVSSRCA